MFYTIGIIGGKNRQKYPCLYGTCGSSMGTYIIQIDIICNTFSMLKVCKCYIYQKKKNPGKWNKICKC